MYVKQLSIFVENKPGRLAAITGILAGHSVDISALSLADTHDFGVLRLIVDKPDEAEAALREAGIAVKITKVLAVVMADVPGGLASVLQTLHEAGVSVEYLYAFVGKSDGKAVVVLRCDDQLKAEEVLEAHDIHLVDPSSVYRI